MFTELLWIVSASLIGFGISAIFAGWLKLPRNIYLLIYIPLILVFFVVFLISYGIDFFSLLENKLLWGLVAGGLAFGLVLKNVLDQPSSPASSGFKLIWDILWPGFSYGLTDSLFLSVFPVLLADKGLQAHEWFSGFTGNIIFGLAALLISFLITLFYHIGYHEFRNRKVIFTLIGNGIMTIAYLLTMNPLSAILPHTGMHIAAMIHGKESTGQVPPHYHDKS